mgnify:CR=1 FL=1
MIEKYSKFRNNTNLHIGNVTASQSKTAFLTNLAKWFEKDETRSLSYKLLDEATGNISPSVDVLDLHFLFLACIEIHERDAKQPEHLSLVKKFCRNQIEIAHAAAKAFQNEFPDSDLPEHTGFYVLSKICLKNAEFSEATLLASTALKQKWAGDWQSIIDRTSPTQGVKTT